MAKEAIDGVNNFIPLDCVSSKSRVKRLVNNIFATVLSEHSLNPLHYVPMERRRDIWGVIAKFSFPGTLPDGCLTKSPGLQRAEELVSQGYGLVIATRHFSNRDFLMLTGFFRSESQISDNKKVYTPLAYHQYTPAAKALLEYFGVKPWPIVTLETRNKGKNYDVSGNELKPGTGGDSYKKAVIELLNNNGILFVAPSTTRTLKHEPWRHMKVIQTLAEETGDKVAFMCVGLDIQDPEITNYEGYQGYNFRERYIISIGATLTKQELLQKAQKEGVTVDRLMANEVAMLVKPETLGRGYEDLQRQRLA